MGIKGLAVAVVDLFFAEHEIVGVDRIPADRPVMYVANHHSGLIDALLLYAASPRDLRAVGKHTLWKILPLRPLLAMAKVIPIHRTQDGGGDNTSSFGAVVSALCEGAAIAIFVEGKSHDEPGLEPIKTGAARMALDARSAGADLAIVPVGLIFEDRERFRSDVLVRIGEPLEISAQFEGTTSEDRSQVLALTAQIESSLRTVAPVWGSVEERRSARSAAVRALPPGATLNEIETAAETANRSGRGVDPDPAVVGERGELDRLAAPPDPYDRAAAGLLAPFALAGLMLNAVPYVLIGGLAAGRKSSIKATVKAAGGLVLYPLWWLAIGLLVGLLSGIWIAGVFVAAAVAALGLLAARELPRARDERRTLASLRQGDAAITASDH